MEEKVTVTLDKETYERLVKMAEDGRKFATSHPLYVGMQALTKSIGAPDTIAEEVEKQFSPEGLLKAMVQRAWAGHNVPKGAGH